MSCISEIEREGETDSNKWVSHIKNVACVSHNFRMRYRRSMSRNVAISVFSNSLKATGTHAANHKPMKLGYFHFHKIMVILYNHYMMRGCAAKSKVPILISQDLYA